MIIIVLSFCNITSSYINLMSSTQMHSVRSCQEVYIKSNYYSCMCVFLFVYVFLGKIYDREEIVSMKSSLIAACTYMYVPSNGLQGISSGNSVDHKI